MAWESVDSVTDTLNRFWETARSTANEGWDAATTAIGDAGRGLQEQMDRISATAFETLHQISLTKTDKEYIFNGPCGITVSFTWSELLMLGGIISSVVFATAAFFTGSLLTGTIYLIYTGLLLFGAYWLSELAKSRTVGEMLQTNTAVARTAVETLAAVVGRFIPVLAGHEHTTAEQVTQLQKLQEHLEGTATQIDAGAAHMDAGAAHMDARVETLPQLFDPIIALLKEHLASNTEVLEAHKQENTHLLQLNETLRGQLDRLGEQIEVKREALGRLEGLIAVLEPIGATLQARLDDLKTTGGDFATERKNLETTIGRLERALTTAQRIIQVDAGAAIRPAAERHVRFLPADLPMEDGGGQAARPVSPVHA